MLCSCGCVWVCLCVCVCVCVCLCVWLSYVQLFVVVVEEDKLRVSSRNVLHHQVMAEGRWSGGNTRRHLTHHCGLHTLLWTVNIPLQCNSHCGATPWLWVSAVCFFLDMDWNLWHCKLTKHFKYGSVGMGIHPIISSVPNTTSCIMWTHDTMGRKDVGTWKGY